MLCFFLDSDNGEGVGWLGGVVVVTGEDRSGDELCGGCLRDEK